MANAKDLQLAWKLWKWRPHSIGQRRWMLCNTKVKVAACGRRWGKSESMAVDIVLFALRNPGSIQIVIAPTDDLTKIVMQQVSIRLHQIEGLSQYLLERKSPYWSILFKDAELQECESVIMTLPVGRQEDLAENRKDPTQILARTAGLDGRGLRGRKANRVIVDEAAFVPDSVMEAVVTPLLADFNGQLVMISTPSGRNHFWRAFERGNDPGQRRYRSFQFPTSSNKYIPSEYIENERLTKPEKIFQVEYEAIFADAEGQVFRYVTESCTGETRSPDPDHRYVCGVDLARLNDFTVLTVIDMSTGEVVCIDRYNKVDWPIIRSRILTTLKRYNDAPCLMEVNNIGDVLVSDLISLGAHVRPFLMTLSSKPNLINALAVAFEQGIIHLPKRQQCPVLVDELQSYAYKRLESGYLTSGAPEGQHDDCVISLALAWKQSGLGGGKRMVAI